MTNTCAHDETIKTAAGEFCRNCGQAQIYEPPKPTKKAPISGVGIAKIWER